MKRLSRSISKYLLQAVLPYFFFSWLLTSVILFVQQAGRYADILFNANIPKNLIWQLTLALVPNIVAFTCPMALLIGVVIGLSRMRGDSELVAVRAAGVGSLQILLPIFLLGVLLSIFTFFVNLYGVPFAARVVRKVAVQTALYKLESPIEPGVFNTEINGYTIYVKDGDVERGTWKNIFIYYENKANDSLRLITSREGRIDSKGETSELVLENANVNTIENADVDAIKNADDAAAGNAGNAADNANGDAIKNANGANDAALKNANDDAIGEANSESAKTEKAGAKSASENRISNDAGAFSNSGEKISNAESGAKNSQKLVSENVGEIRLNIKTKRSEITERFGSSEATPDELGLSDLAALAAAKTGREKIEAQILWQRRIILSLTPLIFAVLGVALALRFNRGGRGFGTFLALACLLAHYLLTLVCEQFARTNQMSVLTAGIVPVAASVFFIVWFFQSKKILPRVNFGEKIGARFFEKLKLETTGKYKSNFYINFSTGISDFDIVASLVKYFFLTLAFLTFVYMIFTAFELWKFAGEIAGGFALLLKYLFYLLPFIYTQLAPSALMIATLAVFVVKSRQNEIVAWTAAGRSVYRLLLPCFLLTIFVGAVNWEIQETILPRANQTQDDLRARIRGRGVSANAQNRYWLADEKRIYSFEFNPNDAATSSASARLVKNLSVYEFSDDQSVLRAIYKTNAANWDGDRIKFSGDARKTVWTSGRVAVESAANSEIEGRVNPFNSLYEKPSHLTARATREMADASEAEVERRTYAVALEKKYATPFLPFIITLFTAPFALSLSRKGRVVTVGYAIGIWLLFVGTGSVFEQLGLNGFVSPTIAVWSPAVFFTLLGVYLLTKVKT